MEIEIRKYLYDIQQACQRIEEFLAGQDFGSYQGNIMLKSAVERQCIIVGEALSQVLKRSPDLNSQISEAGQIVDFRNVIVHGYASISDAVVWDILQTKLSVLANEVSTLLNCN
ncbi:MAG: DUF86 domain-containing protein [Leptolyngbyaceae cyanobacterium SM2_5_2]|nr:DUF86 domain-containing protein [Leptolyngbyaceae cyanobacterium SM2_5_2]